MFSNMCCSSIQLTFTGILKGVVKIAANVFRKIFGGGDGESRRRLLEEDVFDQLAEMNLGIPEVDLEGVLPEDDTGGPLMFQPVGSAADLAFVCAQMPLITEVASSPSPLVSSLLSPLYCLLSFTRCLLNPYTHPLVAATSLIGSILFFFSPSGGIPSN